MVEQNSLPVDRSLHDRSIVSSSDFSESKKAKRKIGREREKWRFRTRKRLKAVCFNL